MLTLTTYVYQDSLSLSVSRHTEELQEINELIPTTDGEMLNRSRQVSRIFSGGGATHVKIFHSTKLETVYTLIRMQKKATGLRRFSTVQ